MNDLLKETVRNVADGSPRNPKVSASIPPPHALNVPQARHVRVERRIAALFTWNALNNALSIPQLEVACAELIAEKNPKYHENTLFVWYKRQQ